MRTQPAISIALCLAAAHCSPSKKPPVEEQVERKLAKVPPKPSARAIEPQVLVLRQVLVEGNDLVDSFQVLSEDIAKTVGGGLVRSGWLAARDSEVPVGHWARRAEAIISLSHVLSPRGAGQPASVVVAIECRLELIDDRSALQPRVALMVEHELSGATDEVAVQVRALVSTSIESVIQSLVTRERLRRASHEELLSVLAMGKDASLKIWALQLVADRMLSEAVPLAMIALRDEDEYVREAALISLVQLGDSKAVSALTKEVDFKDHERLRIVIEAVSALGGEDAQAFLEYVSSGHPDDELRKRAKQSLERLEGSIP